LLTYALARGDELPSQAVEEHARTCVTCREDVATIRQAASTIRHEATGVSARTDYCLDQLTIAALADGEIEPEDRKTALEHLANCAYCCDQLSGLVRLLEAPQVKVELARLDQAPDRRRLRRIVGAGSVVAAAAAVFLLVVTERGQQPATDETHRAAPLTLASPPVALAPVGEAVRPTEFGWTSVPRANLYELTLFDSTGSVLWQQQTVDTFLGVPDSVVIDSGTPYFWRIAARIDFDRWTDTGLIEFTVPQPRGSGR
jgi:hypothetical protein